MATTKKTKKLGKGLDAIFNETSGADIQSMINAIEKNTPKSEQVKVPLKEIRPNPYQPRVHFDEEKLNEILKILDKYNPLIAACLADNREVLSRDILAVLVNLINGIKP